MPLDSKIYLAPLQGFTDFVYRKCYHQVFGGISEYYIPYISFGPGKKIRNSQFREILPENNRQVPVIPQVLCSNVDELVLLASEIENFGYKKINLNLGCPYPMATKRGRGTALLENEESLKEVLDSLFDKFNFEVSVKFRSGLEDEQTIFNRIELLNQYPFQKLIFHPRTAKQLYKGKANQELFPELLRLTDKPLVYNGDILSLNDFDQIQELVSSQNEWMIGRGILMNPFLPQEIKGERLSENEKMEKLNQFHQLIFENYRNAFSDDGHVLTKLKEFWIYFSHNFEDQRKTLKVIKKTKRIDLYSASTTKFFRDF